MMLVERDVKAIHLAWQLMYALEKSEKGCMDDSRSVR